MYCLVTSGMLSCLCRQRTQLIVSENCQINFGIEYEVTGRLTAGRQGEIFLAKKKNGMGVVIKALRKERAFDRDARNAIAKEVAVVKQVPDFCRAEMLDYDVMAEIPYIVFEHIPGPTLEELIKDKGGPMTGPPLYCLAIKSTTMLYGIHKNYVVHGDIRPRNILRGPDGWRFIDYGRSVFLVDVDSNEFGDYQREDIYRLGVLIAHAALGEDPYGTDLQTGIDIFAEEKVNLGPLSGPLREIVSACLRKKKYPNLRVEQVFECLATNSTTCLRRPELGPQ